MEPLTKRQSDILKFLTEYSDANGYPPTYREIGEQLGISSTATVHEHVKNLEAKGYLSCRGDVARSIEISAAAMSRATAAMLPLIGIITAGEPIEAVETPESVAVPSDLAGEGDCYALRVKGDSMIEDGIHSGDLVIVEKNDSPPDGAIVVALVGGTHATLKRIYRERNRVRLQPANRTMKPIYVRDVIVQGRVRGLVRSYR